LLATMPAARPFSRRRSRGSENRTISPVIPRASPLAGSVRWYDPRPHQLSFRAADGHVAHDLDGHSVPYVAKPYRTVLLDGSYRRGAHGVRDIAGLLNTDAATTANILPEIPRRMESGFSAVDVKDDDIRVRIKRDPGARFSMKDLDYFRPADAIRLIIEAAAALAQFQSEVEPTLLVLDEFMAGHNMLDSDEIHSFLADEARSFQVVIATVHQPPDPYKARWLVTTFPHGRQQNHCRQ
jgi:hypothetical protein